MYYATKSFKFEAGHVLDGSYTEICQQYHGHSFKVNVTICSDILNEDGMVMDFKQLKEIVSRIIDPLDHSFIMSAKRYKNIIEILKDKKNIITKISNIIPGIHIVSFNPTAENLVKWIYDEVKLELIDSGVELSKVTFWETETAYTEYKEEN